MDSKKQFITQPQLPGIVRDLEKDKTQNEKLIKVIARQIETNPKYTLSLRPRLDTYTLRGLNEKYSV